MSNKNCYCLSFFFVFLTEPPIMEILVYIAQMTSENSDEQDSLARTCSQTQTLEPADGSVPDCLMIQVFVFKND